MHRDARRTFAWHRQEHNYPVLSKPYFMRRPERKHKKKEGRGDRRRRSYGCMFTTFPVINPLSMLASMNVVMLETIKKR